MQPHAAVAVDRRDVRVLVVVRRPADVGLLIAQEHPQQQPSTSWMQRQLLLYATADENRVQIMTRPTIGRDTRQMSAVSLGLKSYRRPQCLLLVEANSAITFGFPPNNTRLWLNSTTRAGQDRTRPDPGLRQSPRILSGRVQTGPCSGI